MLYEIYNMSKNIKDLSDEFGYDLWHVDLELCFMINNYDKRYVDLESNLFSETGVKRNDMKRIYREFIAFHNSMCAKEDQICWAKCTCSIDGVRWEAHYSH